MQRPSLAHFSRQLSLRYVDLLLPRARVLQSYITHHVAAVARASFTSAVAALCGSRSLCSGVLRASASPHLVATKFNYDAAGSSAHRHPPTWSLPSSIIMQRGPPRIGIPTWSLPSLKCCGFRTRIRHPPPGRYQVYNRASGRWVACHPKDYRKHMSHVAKELPLLLLHMQAALSRSLVRSYCCYTGPKLCR